MINQKNLLIVGGGIIIIAFIAIASWLYQEKGQMGWTPKKEGMQNQYKNMGQKPIIQEDEQGSSLPQAAQNPNEAVSAPALSSKTDTKTLEMELQQTVIEEEDFSDLTQ